MTMGIYPVNRDAIQLPIVEYTPFKRYPQDILVAWVKKCPTCKVLSLYITLCYWIYSFAAVHVRCSAQVCIYNIMCMYMNIMCINLKLQFYAAVRTLYHSHTAYMQSYVRIEKTFVHCNGRHRMQNCWHCSYNYLSASQTLPEIGESHQRHKNGTSKKTATP